jgi:hypothetical protein
LQDEFGNYCRGIRADNIGIVVWRGNSRNLNEYFAACDLRLGGQELEEMIAYFGDGFLQLCGGMLIFKIVETNIHSGGILFEIVQSFMSGLCG